MTLFQHDVIIPDSLTFLLRERELKVNRQDIERFSGKINIRNLTDSTLILSESPTMGNMSYAVVNGIDTLILILRDSLPVRISPHDFRCLYYDSESPYDFLRRFSDKEAWMNMYQLFADSTFCFLNINGKPTGFRIQHDDRYSGIILRSDSLSRTINNESFYDKEDRIRRFFKWDQ